MNRKIIALLLLVVLVVSLMAGCGKKKNEPLTTEDAIALAIETVGVSEDQVADAHPHVGTIDNYPCYNIHLTLVDGTEHNVIINAVTGEVLEVNP